MKRSRSLRNEDSLNVVAILVMRHPAVPVTKAIGEGMGRTCSGSIGYSINSTEIARSSHAIIAWVCARREQPGR